jgi:hypothetical protein
LFNWLLQRPEIDADAELKRLLWDHRTSGGFENALSQVQTDYLLSPSAENKAALESFQGAINGLFSEMDTAFARKPTWEFNNEAGRMLVDFLVRFDAIFTLNQDLLFERFYLNDNVSLVSHQRWNGCIIPGMRALPNASFPFDAGQITRVPDLENIGVPERFQPYYKLHGSYRWEDGTGNGLMVMGGSKSIAIQSHKILQRYLGEFQRHLNLGATRLMVMGYGFADQHINDAIASAEQKGLRMFIVDPLGVDAADPTRDLPMKMPNPFQNVIESASQIPLSQTFGSNLVEHARLMKFFR